MHWTQAVYIGLLIAALASSWRRDWSAMIALVMAANLGATMALAGDPLSVGVMDAACASVLLLGNRRALILATLFSVMILIYVSAWAFSWKNSTTYTIIDLIAYVQLGVISGLDSGIRRRVRAFARRSALPAGPETQGGHATVGVARVSAQSEITQ